MAPLLGMLNSNCVGGNSGGGNAIWIAKQADVTSFTLGTTEYNAVTMEGTGVFKKYEFQDDSFELKEVVSVENGSTIVTTTVEFYTEKMTQAQRDAIQELMDESSCGLIAIVEDNNTTKWTVGYTQKHGKNRKLKITSSEASSGKQLTDTNGASVILTYTAAEKARTFTGTVPE